MMEPDTAVRLKVCCIDPIFASGDPKNCTGTQIKQITRLHCYVRPSGRHASSPLLQVIHRKHKYALSAHAARPDS
jgi:hypothetical protein